MTFPTKNGDIHLIGEGAGILLGKNVVAPVTRNRWGRRALFWLTPSVDARIELFILITMTVAAFHSFQFFGMGELFYIRVCMARGASRLIVNDRENFFKSTREGDGLTFSYLG